MTNEEKAREIASKYERWSQEDDESYGAYNGALEMAEWKEQQMLDKACEWIEKHVEDFMPPTNSLHDYNIGELIHFFKKAMEE